MNIDVSKLNLAIAKSCMTLKDLSAVSGVNTTTLSRIKQNRQVPSPKTVGKIAKALKIDVEELIGS